MKSTNKPPRKPGHNVVNLASKRNASIAPAGDELLQQSAQATGARAVHGRPDDARVKEAMRLAQAFLAIEDPAARSALVALAERLISYDWVRKVK